MITKTDIKNAQNGDYSSFLETVKKTLEEKLENNSFIKNSMSKVEYYKNLTKTLAESKLDDEDEELDDEDEELEDTDEELEDTDDDSDDSDEDEDDSDDSDDDEELEDED